MVSEARGTSRRRGAFPAIRALLPLAAILLLAPSAHAFEWSGKLVEVERGLRSDRLPDRVLAVEALRGLDREGAVRLLEIALRDPDAGIVARALAVVADRGLVEAAPLVAPLATDARALVRAAACDLLPRISPADAVRPVLQRALGDAAPPVRIAAARALVELDRARASAELVPLLDDAADEVRLEVVRLLGELRDPALLHPLLGRVRDPAAPVRARAVAMLGRLGHPGAAPAVIGALADLDPEVVFAAVGALGRLGDRAAVAPLGAIVTGATEDRLKRRAVAALGELRLAEGIPPLLAALRFVEIRSNAAQALAVIGAPAVPALLAELAARADPGTRRPGDPVRGLVLDALATIGDRRATPALLAALETGGDGGAPDPGTSSAEDARVDVLGALARIGDPAALVPVLRLLDAPVAAVRLAAVQALQPIADGRAVDPLLGAAFDSDPRVAAAAIELLGRLRAARAVEPLVELARSGKHDLAAQAATALGLIGDARAVKPLLGLLGDRDAAVRREAAAALANLGDASAAPAILAHLRSPGAAGKPEATRALGAILRGHPPDPRMVDVLAGFLGSGDLSLAASAVDALGVMRAVGAAPALVARFAASHALLRLAIVDALGELGAPAGMAVLHEALRAPDARLRAAAAWAAGKGADRDALPALRPLVADPDPAVRTNALFALGAIGDPADAAVLAARARAEPDRAARANACLALGLVRAPAEAPAREALADAAVRCAADPDELVRASAVRALAELARAADAAARPRLDAALARLATDERPSVRALAGRAGALPPWRSVPRPSWVVRYEMGFDGEPLCAAAAVLVLPTGEMRATATDLHGSIHEESIAEGEVTLLLPEAIPGP
jgi:HEAT repeat protein